MSTSTILFPSPLPQPRDAASPFRTGISSITAGTAWTTTSHTRYLERRRTTHGSTLSRGLPLLEDSASTSTARGGWAISPNPAFGESHRLTPGQPTNFRAAPHETQGDRLHPQARPASSHASGTHVGYTMGRSRHIPSIVLRDKQDSGIESIVSKPYNTSTPSPSRHCTTQL